MRDLDAVDAELTRQVSTRLAQHEWTVIGVVAGESVRPMETGLLSTFQDVEDVTALIVIVCRRSEV